MNMSRHPNYWFLPLSHKAGRILLIVPQPESEPMTLEWKHGVLTTGLPGKSLSYF